MNNVQNRHICVLYLTATCNLKCRYCYIDKSPVLQEIDKLLVDSYKTDYYFNFMKKMFPDPNQLTQIEMWGGEPSYGLPRISNTIRKAIEYYPNLNTFMMSTNLTSTSFISDFLGFLSILKEYPQRHFIFDLQLSLDGPTYINDNNRGIGTTKKFTENFNNLLYALKDFFKETNNIQILPHFKPTLDDSCLDLLTTKQSVIEYYQFFEYYKDLSKAILECDGYKWDLNLPPPNTAVPGMHTVESCKKFTNYCKFCNEIMIENPKKHYLKYPRMIMPFTPFYRGEIDNTHKCRLNEGACTCGTGNVILGLLPNYLISSCHNGFVDLISNYKEISNKQALTNKDRTIDFHMFLTEDIKIHSAYTEDEYEVYEREMNCINANSKYSIIELASLIQLYAFCKQIDIKYKDVKQAVEAAHFIFDHTSFCVRDNIGVTGSRYLIPIDFIKLFLNGAKEQIEYYEQNLLG